MADVESDLDIHTWFGLTYANYLVLPRTILQSMPKEWQIAFVKLLRELDDSYSHLEWPRHYTVSVKDDFGKFVKDPIPHYNRGRSYIEPRLPMEEHRGSRTPVDLISDAGGKEDRDRRVRRSKSPGVDSVAVQGDVPEVPAKSWEEPELPWPTT